MTQTPTANPAPRLTGLLAEDPDLVDRIFEYLIDQCPALAQVAPDIDKAKAAVRNEFGGQAPYIRKDRAACTASQVLSLFNGKNAREVARKLGVSRATVYRHLKRAG